MRKTLTAWLFLPLFLFVSVAVAASAVEPRKPQSSCPVMGGPIAKKDMYVDVNGKRIYICCLGCDEAIRAEPGRYIRIIEKRGEFLEDAPAAAAGQN